MAYITFKGTVISEQRVDDRLELVVEEHQNVFGKLHKTEHKVYTQDVRGDVLGLYVNVQGELIVYCDEFEGVLRKGCFVQNAKVIDNRDVPPELPVRQERETSRRNYSERSERSSNSSGYNRPRQNTHQQKREPHSDANRRRSAQSSPQAYAPQPQAHAVHSDANRQRASAAPRPSSPTSYGGEQRPRPTVQPSHQPQAQYNEYEARSVGGNGSMDGGMHQPAQQEQQPSGEFQEHHESQPSFNNLSLSSGF
ncbi:hypothetical protein [Vibrio mediterranei]|uniref:hypothetical protein n=1 Tax=Vibrio mediterranei TaxID=689 RepID=UPI0040691399